MQKIRKGFTVIEILVSLAVIMVILAISYASYSSFNQRQKLMSAGLNLKNTIRDVQSRTYNRELDCSVCECGDMDKSVYEGWFIDFSNKIYYGRCEGNNYFIKPFNLPDDINITYSSSVLHFLQNPPRADNEVKICLSIQDMAQAYYIITVSSSGMVTDSSTLLSSCPI